MRDAYPRLLGVSLHRAKLSQSGRSSLVPSQSLHQKNKIKNKTTTTTGLKITQPSQTPASMELGSSVKRCCGTGAFCGPWMQQLEPRCAGRSGAGKRNGGMGRNEMLFLRLQSLAVLGRVMVRAVLGVDFIQAGLHTSR